MSFQKPMRYPDPNGLGFLCLANTMDLALAAGECSAAFKAHFGYETMGTVAAERFFLDLKGSLNRHGNNQAKKSQQLSHHIGQGRLLKRAETVFEILSLESRTLSKEANTLFERFRRKIEDGKRLQTKTPIPLGPWLEVHEDYA